MQVIIGIDPGVSGGVVIRSGTSILVWTMEDALDDLAGILTRDCHPNVFLPKDCVCYIERVHASPQMGPSQAFTFGKNFGFLIGVLTALQIPIIEIQPEVWMRSLGCVSKKIDPSGTKNLAKKLFPNIKVTNKTADALLIAEYGRRKEAISSQ